MSRSRFAARGLFVIALSVSVVDIASAATESFSTAFAVPTAAGTNIQQVAVAGFDPSQGTLQSVTLSFQQTSAAIGASDYVAAAGTGSFSSQAAGIFGVALQGSSAPLLSTGYLVTPAFTGSMAAGGLVTGPAVSFNLAGLSTTIATGLSAFIGGIDTYVVGLGDGYNVNNPSASVKSLDGSLTSFGGVTVGTGQDFVGSYGSATGTFLVTYTYAPATAAVPEPGTYALMLLGLAGIAARARRRV